MNTETKLLLAALVLTAILTILLTVLVLMASGALTFFEDGSFVLRLTGCLPFAICN